MGIRDAMETSRHAFVDKRWPTGGTHAMMEIDFNAETAMPVAHGRFDVKRTPQGALDLGGDAQGMHLRFDKTFEGPLQAASVVHMMAVGTAVEGSAGYVAIERLEGSLDGRSGAFSMMHFGVMDRGQPSLRVEVVPDSGTGELVGLRGAMTIDITNGKHAYTLDYTLPAA